VIGSVSGENDDSYIRYYCNTEELFDVNIGHKRTRGKRQCFVIIPLLKGVELLLSVGTGMLFPLKK